MAVDGCVLTNGLNKEEVRERVATLGALGYGTIALATEARMPIERPVPPPEQVPDEPVATGSTWGREGGMGDSKCCVRQLRKLVVAASEPQHVTATRDKGFRAMSEGFDVIALRPETTRCFELACTSSSGSCRSIVVDPAYRLPFRPAPGPLKKAAERGIALELFYGSAVSEGASFLRQAFASCAALAPCCGNDLAVAVSSGRVAAREDVRSFREVMFLKEALLGRRREKSSSHPATCVGAAGLRACGIERE